MQNELGGTLGSPRTYHYTDAELQSLLTCVLDDDGRLDAGHSLQFLPHLPMPTSITAAHQHQHQQPAVFIPTGSFGAPQAMPKNAADLSLGLPPLRIGQQPPLRMNGDSLQVDTLGSHSSAFTMAGTPGAVPPAAAQQRHQTRQAQRPGQRPGAGSTARAASLPAPATTAPKQPHSLVEKQRRDRINHLIDELRDLVPPQSTSAELGAAMAAEAAAAGDSRRPKHIVLSDAIRLIKGLQLQVAEMQASPPAETTRPWQGEHEMVTDAFNNSQLHPQVGPVALQQQIVAPALQQQQQEAAQQQLYHQQQQYQQQQFQQQQLQQQYQQQQEQEVAGMEVQGASEQAATQQAASGSLLSGERPHPELPHAPDDDAASDSGVVVESEAGQIKYVKVTCPDRHGLLADVVRALRELPLEITTAAITTRRDHVVYDGFEVEVEDPGLTQDQLRSAVEAALHPAGEKKRKQESQQSPCTALLAG